MDRPQQESLLRDVYRDLAVCLGGVFAVHEGEVPDEVIWEITRSVGGLFRRHRNRVLSTHSRTAQPKQRPHQAIVHLLSELQGASR